MSFYDLAVPTLKRTLTSLSAMLAQGESHAAEEGIDPDVLVNARLAPDMYPLKRQIQIASDTARRGCARLIGSEAPAMEDTEETFDALQERIRRTIDYLDSLDREAFEGAESRTVELPLGDTTLQLDGGSFLMGFLMANFSFHVVTAYNILRHNGVAVGKRDYLGAQ